MNITDALEATKISRYYASTYADAEKSNKLDKLFGSLSEQKAYFSIRKDEAARNLRGTLSAVRVMYCEKLRTEKDIDARQAIKLAIEGLDRELA